MKFFQEFFIIIFFSVLGEGIRIFAHLPIPGSILGILFLFLAFEMHLVDPEKIGATGDFLLNIFVPAGVGLLEYFDDIASIWPVLLGAVVVCSIVTMVAAGKTAEGVEALLGYVRKKKAERVSVNEMEENQID
ncbi:TPA: CidA/LrgA family protein [Enterococcus faecium]|nr:CidA/LrgA family protein [Enterococcus faecium]